MACNLVVVDILEEFLDSLGGEEEDTLKEHKETVVLVDTACMWRVVDETLRLDLTTSWNG